MARRKNSDIMTTKVEPKPEAEISKLDLAIRLAKEIQNKKKTKEVIEDDDTDDDDVQYFIQTKTKSVVPPVPVEIPVPAEEVPVQKLKKPRVKKEKIQPQIQPQIQAQIPPSYNYEKIRYLEQENERLKNSLKFNALSRIQNFSNGMKIKF
jgi:hypothetical protein